MANAINQAGWVRVALAAATAAGHDKTGLPAPEPLTATPGAFWEGAELPEGLLNEVRVPPVAAALPKRLGSFPLWRGLTFFLDTLEPFYTKAAATGLDVFLGELNLTEDVGMESS